MPYVSVNVQSFNDRNANAEGEWIDEFDCLHLPWKERGFVYCYLDSHSRSMAQALRRGWKVCNVDKDFRELGCPDEVVEKMPLKPGGTFELGDTILAKMPATLYARRDRERREKRMRKRRAFDEEVQETAARVDAYIRKQGGKLPDGGSILSRSF